MIFISPLAGRLIARFGARGLMTVGMLCGLAGLVVLTQITDTSGYGLLLPGYLLFGIALGLVYAPMSTAAMAAMPREKTGIASGVLAMDRVLAGALALAVTGAVFQSLVDDQSFALALAHSTWVLVGLLAVGTVLTWLFVRSAPGPSPDSAVAGSPSPTGAAPPPSPPPLPSLAVGMAQRGRLRWVHPIGREAYPGRMAAVEPHSGTADGLVAPADVERAAELIAGQVRETPVLRAGELSRRVGAPVVLKAECLQLTGSFKVRGAIHKMGRLSQDELDRGVATASAGNHAQAVALAAERLGSRADLFMPIAAPLAKVAAVRGYGGEVHLVDGSYEEAAEEAAGSPSGRARRSSRPSTIRRSSRARARSDWRSLGRRRPTRLVVGAARRRRTGVRGGDRDQVATPRARRWSASRPRPARRTWSRSPPTAPIGARSASTICDGIAVKQPGELTLPLVERHLDEVVTVSDDQVAEAMVLLLERSKLVVEGAGAVGVAALLAGKVKPPAEGETCVVLSGGNVDASRLAECIRLGETAAGRRIVLWTVVPDRPGALAALLRLVAEQGANVMDVEHIREGVELHVRETAIELVLQTDGPDHSERILEAVRAEGFSARLER